MSTTVTDSLPFTPLSAEQRQHFEENGYLIFRNVLSEEHIAALLEVGDRLIASDEQRNRQCLDGGRYDSFRNCVAMDPAFLQLITHPVALSAVTQLLSPNIQVHTSHLIYKQPDDSAEEGRRSPGWHRDINTCPWDLGPHATPRMEIKVNFQLSDASQPGHGQTLLCPGSHHFREPLWKGDDGDPSQVVEPLLRAGDVVLFENRTYHAGGHNKSGITRKNFMLGYSYRWMSPDDYLMQEPSLLAQCSPIQQQLLGGMGGLFDANGNFNHLGSERPLSEWCAEHGVAQGWKENHWLPSGGL
jgi:ectoine hydroxylase-related dioxygenase (phytanoyl-CoA dioxygenase family)